ncbi:MAG TPA: RNA polymerase sigma factor [Candidatus Binataceae bacterium]|nr:RNA polymerase sigma factor [Candidatus Binataceae bacterium]
MRKLSALDATMSDNESSLRERLKRGDPIAAREFFELYSSRIHRFILHALGPNGDADAEDILQESFMALAEALPFFRGDSSLFTFACAIAHRKTASFIRTRARRGELLKDHTLEAVRSIIDPPSDPDLKNALESLSAEHREVLILKYVEDMPVAEIAAVLSLTEHAVESRLTRARKALMKALG